MFLMGQETWPPPACVDTDGDGYGNPASASCAQPGLDCDDTNPNVHPGAVEGPYGDPVCADVLDNDCDGLADVADTGCWQCSLPAECNDGNPCTDDDCMAGLCVNTNNAAACDDGDGCTQTEACSGGVCVGFPLDADSDTFVSNACGGEDCDDADAAVFPAAPELCDGTDNQCPGDPGYGVVDEGCGIQSLLPDTGIMTCYNDTVAIECPAPGQPFFGQDAQYTTNPMTYTVNGDATVTDNVTGLVWQRCSAGLNGSNCSVGSVETRTWANAITYCEGLDLAGHTDWRLPDEYELQSIVDYGRYNPAIDTTAFPGTNSSGYWSSSTYAHDTFYAWYVPFYKGTVYYSSKDFTFYVRCVR